MSKSVRNDGDTVFIDSDATEAERAVLSAAVLCWGAEMAEAIRSGAVFGDAPTSVTTSRIKIGDVWHRAKLTFSITRDGA